MKITAITQQQKRANRYSIYIDDKFNCGLSVDDLSRLQLSVGQELTLAEAEDLATQADNAKAYDRALGYLSLRPRSEQEMRQYLRRKECTLAVIDQVITRLAGLKLIDDTKFAADWVAWRQATSLRSRRKLTSELIQKGIAKDIITATIGSIDDDTEMATIKDVIAKKRSRYRDSQKLIAYLGRQGFSYDLISKCLKDST